MLIRLNLLVFKMLRYLKKVFFSQICCVSLPKNKFTTMKKDKTNDSTGKRKMSKLEKENAKLKAQNEQLKSDNKQLRGDLRKERKKKDVKVIELSSEQERLLSILLKGTPIQDS